jgi:hypothetical protein
MATTRAKGGSRSGKSGGGSGNLTIDHQEIRRWVEERGGRPACVKGTERGDSCLLRIDYPGFSGEDTLEPMDWDEFFDTFDENNLAFLYQDSKKGKESRFSKFVSRDGASGRRSSSRGSSQSRSGGNSPGRASQGSGSRRGGQARGGQSRAGQTRTPGRASSSGRSNKSSGRGASARGDAKASGRRRASSSRRSGASAR